MNVQDLIDLLETFPDNLEVVVSRHSDYQTVNGVELTKGIDKGFYVMRDYTGSDDTKVKTFLELI